MLRHYFDHNATTPVAPVVLEAYVEAVREAFGNPSSVHQDGQRARQCLETARRQAAVMLGVSAAELVFTSGGTEANNLALGGVVAASGKARPHVITTAIEHPAVTEPCQQLARQGADLTVLPVGGDGVVDPDDVRRALRPETVLVSVMHVNNETGVIQPVREVASLTRQAGVLLHADGVQAVGKMPVDLRELGVDLYSMSGHKLFAPKGVGLLYVRKGVTLQAQQSGGRHEQGRRAGTENVPGAVALGRACALVMEQSEAEAARIAALRDRLESGILDRVPGVSVNGAPDRRVGNTSNLRFDGIGGESMVIALDLKGFALSSGSACSSGAVAPSPVLTAMGLSAGQARASVRFSLGPGNTEAQVDDLTEAVVDVVAHLRRVSPAYRAHA